MLGIAKPRGCLLPLAMALDMDFERSGGDDAGDVIIMEERFERSQADHVVGQLAGDRALFDLVEHKPVLGHDLADQLREFGAQGRLRNAAGGD